MLQYRIHSLTTKALLLATNVISNGCPLVHNVSFLVPDSRRMLHRDVTPAPSLDPANLQRVISN